MQDLIRAIASGMRSQAIRYLARSSKNSGFSELKYLFTILKRKQILITQEKILSSFDLLFETSPLTWYLIWLTIYLIK